MAPIEKKRKSGPTNESFARSRNTTDGNIRPAKRPRAEDGDTTTKSRIPHVPKISKIRDEEVAFPRGGASLLTPLEHKQIQIQATQDVLFEQGASSKSEEANADGETSEKKRHKPKKGKGIAMKVREAAELEEEGVRIEGLSYKVSWAAQMGNLLSNTSQRIVPGSTVLGVVSQINDLDIALSLPNNLTGYVPITSISDKITERIEAIAGGEREDEEETETEDVDLKKMFRIGQYLRAYVVSTKNDDAVGSGQAKRHIELSLRPQQSNTNITLQNVVTNNTLMASVASVEDHGLVMDLGLPSPDVKGFMSSKDIGHGVALSSIDEGAVFLCTVIGLNSSGKIIKLSMDPKKIANPKKLTYLSDAPTIDAFLPGTAVEILVSDVTSRGISGKVMGSLDVTADLMHSGAGANASDLEKKYKIGSKVKGRVICTFPNSQPPKLGVSLLDHVMTLSPQQGLSNSESKNPLDILPLSSVIEGVKVKKVEPGMGLFVDVGVRGVAGFVHISRVKDGKIETLAETSGPFKAGSIHRGRLIGYNALDGMFIVSLEPSIIAQPFLRIEDVPVGGVVKGTVEKIVVNDRGVGGLLVNLADGISGLVPEAHMADVHLLHPEKKFKEGSVVTARVLSTNPGKRQLRLTLKKTLVNSDAAMFVSYGDIQVGMQSPGTIINILPNGAVVQFYGTIRGFLPIAEMSEAYIQDPSQHFRVGQVVNVHVIHVIPEENRLVVSCKDPAAFGLAQQAALKKLKLGEIVSAVVTEKTNDSISLDLHGIRATISIDQLTDGSPQKNASALKKIRVGQTLTDLVVLQKLEHKRSIILTNKPKIVKDAKTKLLLRSFEDVKEGKVVHGFVKNITLTAVFVQFAGGLTGLLPKVKLPEDALRFPDFGLKKFQTLQVKITRVDHGQRQFQLSMVDVAAPKADEDPTQLSVPSVGANQEAVNPIDTTLTSLDDLTLGRLTKAKISSIKETQINVQLADNIQGRIDISQVFDSFDEIKDRKKPLRSFSPKQILDVRVLGIHDAKNHRFLPISHRSGKTLVFELSAKPSDQCDTPQDPLTLDKVKVGSSWIVYVNNIREDFIWVNLSPNVRGRIPALDLSDDVSKLKDLALHFPIGSAIKVHVKHVDTANNRLDLSALSGQSPGPITLKSLSKGMVVTGKVTKSSERHIMVQLSDSFSAPVNLPDLADDFSEADPTKYSKGEIVRVCVTDIDLPNKKIRLSTRPSRVLNSSLEVKDPEISEASQLKLNDIVRGFIKNVTDSGIFVNLGGRVDAYVKVAELSDSFVKDWQSEYEVDQLVKGKVIGIDKLRGNVQMSLKASALSENYVPPMRFEDLKPGQIVTGKIRKVEDFGVFIVIDGANRLSGLCHRSQIADRKVDNVKDLYQEGDQVKAKIVYLDAKKRQISFGLKASYFPDDVGSRDGSDDEDLNGMEGAQMSSDSNDQEDEEDGGIDLDNFESIDSHENQVEEDSDLEMPDAEEHAVVPALSAGGFDWSANVLEVQSNASSDNEDAGDKPKKKKRRKAEIKVDRTGDLDANGPQSVSDFERLLLGQPDSSALWIQYMAFQMQLSELRKAREVAERAIKTINIREEVEKMNVWIALLNLENAYGSDETLEDVFKRACQYNDAQEIHERLTSIYIQSGKHGVSLFPSSYPALQILTLSQKADDLFQVLVKKFSQSPNVWTNYAHFLHSTLSSPERARALLSRAKQSLPTHTHVAITLKFAALEFHSKAGSPERGRTMFEALLTTFPKRLDIWNQLLDLEIQQGDKDITRGVFERMVKTNKGLKPKQAMAWFRRWSEWEEGNGDKKSKEKVLAKTQEWVSAAAAKKAKAGGEDE